MTPSEQARFAFRTKLKRILYPAMDLKENRTAYEIALHGLRDLDELEPGLEANMAARLRLRIVLNMVLDEFTDRYWKFCDLTDRKLKYRMDVEIDRLEEKLEALV